MQADDEMISSDSDEWECADDCDLPPPETPQVLYAAVLAVLAATVYIALGMRRSST